jgi:transposase
VRPFVKSNKNDYRDAETIAEAVERENMRFMPLKTEDQLDVQALHRVRERQLARLADDIHESPGERSLHVADNPVLSGIG